MYVLVSTDTFSQSQSYRTYKTE